MNDQEYLSRLDFDILNNLYMDIELALDSTLRKMNMVESGGAEWAKVRVDILMRKAEVEQAIRNKGEVDAIHPRTTGRIVEAAV